jgi:pyrroline-5-carboxylate reductase
MTRLGIIGATGWLGSALGRGTLEAGLARAPDLVLLNRSGARPEYHGHKDVTWASGVADLVQQVDAVVVAVRPEDYTALGLQAPGRLLVSFMAGVPMAALARTGGRLVRAMPNAAAESGRSYTPWIAASDVTSRDRRFLRSLLATIGTEDEVGGEDSLDYLTALSGSGAAYPALMAQTMLADARARGLPDPIALRAVEAAVCDGAEMLRGRIATAPALVETYRNYRGTTAAGLDAAHSGGFAEAIRQALEAAARRAGNMWTD